MAGPFEIIKDSFLKEFEFNGMDINLTFKTECSMADGKMVSLLQGDSGAFCHFCSCTKAFCNDLANFQNGFNIDKNYESCLEAWRKLEDGSIEYTSRERQG